jgi:hypothetical protein
VIVETNTPDLSRPDRADRHINPAVAWLGWTVLMGAVSYLILEYVPDAVIWGPFLIALLIGAASGSAAILISPFLIGAAGMVLIAYLESRNPGTMGDSDTGVQGMMLGMAILSVIGFVGAGLGFTLGEVVRRRGRNR